MTTRIDGLVAMNVSIRIDVAQFQYWTEDRITAFFDGAAKMLAAANGTGLPHAPSIDPAETAATAARTSSDRREGVPTPVAASDGEETPASAYAQRQDTQCTRKPEESPAREVDQF